MSGRRAWMPSRLRAALPLAAALCCLCSCRYGLNELFSRPDPVDARVSDTSIPAPRAPSVPDPDNYVFVATADTHFTADRDPPAAAAFKALVAERGAAFVIIAGDLADAGLEAELARYAAWTATLGVPVYSAVGNHDLYNDGWTRYQSAVGRAFYSFTVGARSFYVLDSGNGTLGRTQMDMLRDAFLEDARGKVIVCHYPLYDGEAALYYKLTNKAERAALIDLYARNGVELILEGHQHVTRHARIGEMDEWLCSSLTGGAGQGRCVTVTVSNGKIASVTPELY
jgi:3',5'-cyclic-AMP phosphodiesterase